MTATSAERPLQATGLDLDPVDILMNLVITLLAPMFLTSADGDVRFARIAALHTVDAYRVRCNADLLTVAQIIGFGLAALGSLGLSMAEDLSVSLVLRLRGNANALNRSAEQNRRALRQSHADAASPVLVPGNPGRDDAEIASPVDAAPKMAQHPQNRTSQAKPLAPQPQAEAPASDLTDRQRQALWGAAMADVAAELTADLGSLPPEEQRIASLQAAALRTTADALLSGATLPPASFHLHSQRAEPCPPVAAASPARPSAAAPGRPPFPA